MGVENMKRFTAEQFLDLPFKITKCQILADHELEKHDETWTDDKGREYGGLEYTSWLSGEFIAEYDGMLIKYGWDASANKAKSLADAFNFEITLGESEFWEWNSFELIDEDGDVRDRHETAGILRDFADQFLQWEEPVKRLLPTAPEPVAVEPEQAETEGFEEFEIERDDAPSLKFVGKWLASASSKSAYNNNGRWTVLRLYKTRGGKHIASKEGITCWQGEHNRFSAAVCNDFEAVKKFFGHGRLAKEIYEDAGIDA